MTTSESGEPVEAALAEAVGALVGVLPGCSAGQARVALVRVVTGSGSPRRWPARYRSLARHLTAVPEALVSGQPPTPEQAARLIAPQDLSRLAAWLARRGHGEVVVPVRRCLAGQHSVPQGWAPSRACMPCQAEQALDQTAAAVVAVLPGLPVVQARAAVAAVTAGGLERLRPARHRAIGAWLALVPDALCSGDAAAPPDVARLIGELARLGRTDIALPRCADCGQTRFLRQHRQPDGARICVVCDHRRRVEPCAGCGRTRRVTTRDGQGRAVCGTCRRADPASWRRCDGCGQLASIRMRRDGQQLGRCCYLRPQLRCSVCGVGRAEHPWQPGTATCPACAAGPLATCTSCGLDAPPSADPAAPALCRRCQTGATRACAACGQLTISRAIDGQPCCTGCYQRPTRTCGRCGRRRVIVRLAIGSDPDLCKGCWSGPVMACEGCGKLRPCRGERAGRMLCRGCRPRPKRACTGCGNTRRVAALWPGGPVCSQCYRHAMRAKGDCPGCGRRARLLAHPGVNQPVCAACAGAPPGPVCAACGNQDWLYAAGRCARCVLAGRLDRLLGRQAHRQQRGLEPLAQALLGAERPEAVLGWLRGNRPATSILARLGSGALACSHEVFDELAATTRTASFIDDLLTTLGTLPARDSELDRLDRQVHQLLGSIGDVGQQRLLRRWATWAILRRHRAASQHTPLTAATRRNATASVRAAAHLLAWLDRRGQTLGSCAQPDLDAYLLEQPSHRSLLGGFLTWAYQHRAAPRLACTRPARPIAAIPADHDQRWALARRLLHQPGPPLADRVAALLIVLLGQRPSRISQLTTSNITINREQVHLHLGSSPVQVPEPLAGHLRELLATRIAPTQAHLADPGPWLFPGMHAGQPAGPVTISRRVRRLGVDRTHRAGALLQLCGQLPAPVVADLLGLSAQTALAWARLAGRPWADYPELRSAPPYGFEAARSANSGTSFHVNA